MMKNVKQNTIASWASSRCGAAGLALAATVCPAPASAQSESVYFEYGCIGCHGEDGEGRTGVAPPLADNPHLENTEYVVSQILIGRGIMPAFGDVLTNEQVATVVNRIRTSWGNDFERIDSERVAEIAQAPSVESFAAFEGAAGEPARPRDPAPAAPSEAPTALTSPGAQDGGAVVPSELVHVPIVNLFVGGIDAQARPEIENPVADDPEAAQRGMQYYNRFNCIGCHAPNGAGGMGPALSNASFIYGSEPENIYLSILQGRPAGMPPWGLLLPDHIIWDLVAYIESISKEPSEPWGATVSADGFTIEQVPAEFMQTVDPWKYTNPFSYGQAPFEKPKGSPPLETPEQ